MRIVVVGAGAIGGLLGARLAATGHDVVLYDTWSAHVAAIQRSGLLVEQLDGTRVRYKVSVTERPPETISAAELVLVQVKAYDTYDAVAAVADRVRPATFVLSLQNGLGNEEQLRGALPSHERLLLGTTAHGSTVLGPGRLRHAGRGPTVIGDPSASGEPRFDLRPIAGALTRAGFETEIAADIHARIWTKLAANVAINPVCALSGTPIGGILDDPALLSLSEAAVGEFVAVLRAAGVAMVEPDYFAYARHIMQLTRHNLASMLQDIQAGRRTEIDAINGAVARRGAELGVPTPVNNWLTTLVHYREAEARRSRVPHQQGQGTP